MAKTYTDEKLPVFEWTPVEDIGPSDLVDLDTYNNMIANKQYGEAYEYLNKRDEQTGEYTCNLRKKSFGAAQWNALAYAIQETEEYFNDNVENRLAALERHLTEGVVLSNGTYAGIINLESTVFLTKIKLDQSGQLVEGTYTFTYTSATPNNYWCLTGPSSLSKTNVKMADYGITLPSMNNYVDVGKTIIITVDTDYIKGAINDTAAPSTVTTYSSKKTDEILDDYNNRTRLLTAENIAELSSVELVGSDWTLVLTGSQVPLGVYPNFHFDTTDEIMVLFETETDIFDAGTHHVMCKAVTDNEQRGILYMKKSTPGTKSFNIEAIKVVKE